MEEKKLDGKSIIGFALIFVLLIWVMYNNRPTEEEIAAEKAKQELVEKQQQEASEKPTMVRGTEEPTSAVNFQDSLKLAEFKNKIGAFQFGVDSNTKEEFIALENDVIALKISTKGGQIVEARVKNFDTHDSLPLYLIKDKNSVFNLLLSTQDNRTLQTHDLFFKPTISKDGNQLSMKLLAGENKYLEYHYTLRPGEYMVDFALRSQGLNSVLNAAQQPELEWNLRGRRNSKSVQYENRYTELYYKFEGDKVDYLSASGTDDEIEKNVEWISYKQHFFSSILISNTPFNKVELASANLAEDDSPETKFSKQFSSKIFMDYVGGELNYGLKWYFGPTELKEFNKYKEIGLDESIPFGWGIFGWINRYMFTPLYSFLSGFLPAGIAIIIMTILVRLLMSPVTYKSYLSQAKMKVLRPEINEINEKFKDNAMKKQQETMKLYGKAGVNPMSGCVPALLQLPVFYALFMFFPSAFVLRQKRFLWAEDLSAYDSIAQLPFTIPFYGDHVSLFPILASVAIFFYMQMTTGQSMQMQQQPGMPNMKFIMYLSPVMMLFFFNSYASGLSLYYFVSNLITIFIMLAIKNWIIDEDKIHAKIQENKAKPKKKSRFQQKMAEMMEQAEAQKAAQDKKRKK
ncbi:MAG: membrane protein insertase YidC [Flavobacteriaceae bacterium]|nr:membrane protein insertase YidC [Flavobacteriaceae bacterium]